VSAVDLHLWHVVEIVDDHVDVKTVDAVVV